MTQKRSQYNGQFKFKVAIEAVNGAKTTNEIISEHGLNPNQVSGWKKQLLEAGPDVFQRQSNHQERERVSNETELYEQIDRLKHVLSLPQRWNWSG